MRKPSREFALVAALLAFALAVRFYRIGWGLPGIYEEATPFWKAWGMWGWGPERRFDPNPHFFTYPSLTIYLQFLGQGFLYLASTALGKIDSAIGFRILYELDKTWFFVIGRSIGATIGAATVLPTYFLARRAGGHAAAIPAALLVALNPLLIARSHVIEVDVPLTFFVALACVFAVRMSEAATLSNCIGAGLAAGLAASSKYPGLMVLLAPLAATLFALRARPAAAEAPPAGAAAEPPRRKRAGRRQRPDPDRPRAAAPRRHPRAAVIPAPLQIVVLFAAFALALFATSPFVFLDAGSTWRELSMAGEHMRLGHFGSAVGRAWLPYARDWVSSIMGLPLGLASLAGLAYFALWRRTPWAIVLAGFFVPFAAVVGSWSRAADNYVMPLIPLGTVFATALVAQGARRAIAAQPSSWARAAVSVATALFAVPLLAGYATHLKTLEGDSRAGARAWIETQVPSGALIATEMLGPELTSLSTMLGWDQDLRSALRARGYQPKVYALEYIAMITIAPEQSARFYDLRLYEPADYIVVTGAVRDRYLAEPRRFRPQVAFYEALRRSWIEVRGFRGGGTGSDIVIYRNPVHDRPFAMRPPGPVPALEVDASSPLTGEEQAFYYNMGLNYEGFGFLNRAVESYERGLRLPSNRPERYTAMSRRLAGILIRQKRVAEALAFLEGAAQGAPSAKEAAALRRTRETITALESRGSSPP